MKYIYVILSLFYIHDVNAQKISINITGSVQDFIKRRPLYASSVSLLNSVDSTVVSGCITNEKGIFSLKGKEDSDYLLQISYLGYHTEIIRFSTGAESICHLGRLSLKQKSFELESVNIICKPLLNFDDENVIVNVEALGNVENLSIADVVEIVPGAYFDSDGKLRYQGYGNFIKLIGGKRIGSSIQNNSSFGSKQYYELKQIPAKYIKEIEILPEPRGKYGFFIPIINIVPKGNLTSFYNLDGEYGSSNSYLAGVRLTQKWKKLTFTARVGIEHPNTKQDEKRTRNYFQDNQENISEFIKQKSIVDRQKFNFQSFYDFNSSSTLSVFADLNSLSLKEKYTYFDLINKGLEKLELRNTNANYVNITSTYRYFYSISPKHRMNFSLNSKIETNKNKNKHESLNQSHKSFKHNQNNLKLQSDLFYYYSGKQSKFSARGIIELNRSIDKSTDNLNLESESFLQQNQILEKTIYSLNATADRKLKLFGISYKIKLKFDLKNTYETIKDRVKETKQDDDRINANWLWRLNRNFKVYGNSSLQYSENLRWPSAMQKIGNPTFVGADMIEQGNPNLKHETQRNFAFDLSWNPSGVIYHTASPVKRPKCGYTFHFSYNQTDNKIERIYETNSSGRIISTYANTNTYKAYRISGHFQTNISKKTNFKIGGEYVTDNFNRTNNRYTDNWQAFATYKINAFKRIEFGSKYTYYSSTRGYNTISESYQSLSFNLSGMFFKNSTYISLSGENLLNTCNRNIIIEGVNYKEYKRLYPEKPIIRLKVAYNFYKFYKRK